MLSVCGFALLIFGCPKRQPTRIVYTPAPPPVPLSTEAHEVLAIEEPAPPEPVEVAAPEPVEPPPAQPRPVPRTQRPPVELPALEPRETPEQQAALRRQLLGLQEHLQDRIRRLDRPNLPTTARRTLDDARAFLVQSQRALENGDLQRARNLASKAGQLVSALEGRP